MRTLKAVGLLTLVAAAVMVPLYGSNAPVIHPEWGRMLLRALELEDDLPPNPAPRLVFSTLSWKNSLAYPAERYLSARGVEVVGAAGARQLVASGGPAEVAYPLTVVRAGDYRLRVQMSGDPAQPASAGITPAGAARPTHEFTMAPPAVPGWVEVGGAHLDPGGYTAGVVMPAGSSLQRLEVAPRCLAPIEPLDGWKDTAVATGEDVAVTTLQALDILYELPPAAAPIEKTAADFRLTVLSPAGALAPEPGQDGLWLRGGARGVSALLVADLPEAGLYTLYAFGSGGSAQGWLVDSCQKTVLCPQPDAAAAGPTWRPVVTAEFTAGRHSFLVTLPAGAGLGRVRLERKKDAGADHVATLARLGFDVGAPGPVARERAVAAAEFIRDRRSRLENTFCGDLIPPDTLEAGLAEPAPVTGPAEGTFAGLPPGGTGVPLPGPSPATPPVTVPPVTVPPVTVPPVTTPPTTTPPAPPPTTTPGPPPATIPPQPPGSPTTIPTPPPV